MYDELVKSLRICGKIRSADDYCVAFHDGCCEAEPVCMYELMMKAADAIEELSKRLNSVTAERDAAMKRLCEWCGVGCSMENRRAELCEIASVGLEFLAEEE